MKILRNFLVILLALFLLNGGGRDGDSRLAAASENANHVCDHSACAEEVALLELELKEAKRSSILVLRVELELLPGLLGDWARLDFHSAPLEISGSMADGLCVGQDLCQSQEERFIDRLLGCRIIVEELIASA